MRIIKALAAVFGLRNTAKNRFLGKAARRWSGLWMLLLVLDIIRSVRRHQRRVIARRVLKDDEILVISSSNDREH